MSSRFVARTVVNPTKKLADYVATILKENTDLKTGSLLVAVSPQHANEMLEFVGNAELPTVGVAVDSLPLGAQRNGYSFLALKDKLHLSEQSSLENSTSNSQNAQFGSRGVVSSRENWMPSASFIAFELGKQGVVENNILLPAANTTFVTGLESAIAFNDRSLPLSHTLLSSLKVSIPTLIPQSLRSVAPLIKITEPLNVTSFKDNMIKTLNNSPAAAFLENAPRLTEGDEHTQSQRKVYAVITALDGTVKRYQVVAGGGGSWSPRAQMLVLEPEARFAKGDTIHFTLFEPSSKSQATLVEKLEGISTLRNALIIESTPVAQSINEAPLIMHSGEHVANVFGLGSEAGFVYNETKHSVEGETVALDL